MDLSEANVHSFVVRIWLEEEESEIQEAIWRGHVTHVPSGERRYIKRLSELNTFIIPYLEAMGVRFNRDEDASGQPSE